MPEVREQDVYKALLKSKGEGQTKVGKTEIRISLNPVDIHSIGRPDNILWFESTFEIFGQSLRISIPIPIEAEKNGIDDAIEDLDGFVERKKYYIEIPMLVIAEAGYAKREEIRSFPTKFLVSQIPIRRLKVAD
ncbi:MAG: hypothetical protein ACTSRU_19210 [Candidatus Hodarchaeales archaeon]